MSNTALNAVFGRSRTKNGARLLMLALADRADAEGRAWPSIADLMRRTALSRGAMHQAMKEARRLGELEVDPFSGPRLCNVYKINLLTRSDSEPHSDCEPIQILNGPVQILNKTRSDSESKPSLTLKNLQSLDRARRKANPKPEDDPDFAIFWDRYPRKRAKPAALKAWRATANERPPVAELLAALDSHIASDQWRETRYVPYPATWLNQHRWADELKTSKANKPEPMRVRL